MNQRLWIGFLWLYWNHELCQNVLYSFSFVLKNQMDFLILLLFQLQFCFQDLTF